MKNNKLFGNPFFWAGLLSIIVIAITSQSLLLAPKTFGSGEIAYTHYNNYLIFKQSFFHLIGSQDLYQLYPAEHWDLYKYSPTFSLLMAPLAVLPDMFGLFFWNLLNSLLLFFALWKLPGQTDKTRLYMLGFVLIELITSVQNAQSNGLMAGLIIFAFIFLERKQTAWAALLIVLTIFIKLFGLVALALFIFYPNKLKAAAYTVGWAVLLAVLPLLVVSMSQLVFLYQSWFDLLQNDHSASVGLSVAGWLSSWFGVMSKGVVIATGVLLFGVPLLRFKVFNELRFRLFFLASILIWVVIFNHKAESTTFVIAISGVAIWFFSQATKWENVVLVILALLFTILSPTDIFPRGIRDAYVGPYVLKAMPCILIWGKIWWDMVGYQNRK